MSNIKGTIVNIKDFLSNKSVEITIQNSDSDHVVFKLDAERSYCIPDFQREIRWSVENLYELMSDIYSCDKFLGNVILTRHKNNKYYIIDGQQRISMLFMLVHFIKRKYYEEHLDEVYNILKEGTNKANEKANKTLKEVKKAIMIDFFEE